MKISSQTIAAFSAVALSQSRQKLAAALRQALPAETEAISEDDMWSFCDRGILRAAQYAFQSEYEVYVFLAATLAYGAALDGDRGRERVREILDDRTLDSATRAQALELEVAIDTGKRI